MGEMFAQFSVSCTIRSSKVLFGLRVGQSGKTILFKFPLNERSFRGLGVAMNGRNIWRNKVFYSTTTTKKKKKRFSVFPISRNLTTYFKTA